ncbi:MAG: endonuclease/exonuclease/phosphatase family protein [Hyphomicrobiaceae bacterium]
MRIATFNVESLDEPVAPRLPVLRPALERIEADIICLQEVNGQRVPGQRERALTALDALLADTSYAGFHRVSTHGHGREGAADVHNLVTLSRFPITSHAQILHERVPPAVLASITAVPPSADPVPIRFERPLLHAEIEVPDGRLHVINVHLRAPIASPIAGQKAGPFTWRSVQGWAEGYYHSGLKRLAQALELRLVVDRLLDADPEARIVVAGDFNAEANETPIRLVAGVPEDTGNAELAGRALVVLDRAIEGSRRFSVVHHGRPQMLDHILASHAALGRFRGIEVHNEALGDEAVAWASRVASAGSYHAAIVATFAA